MNGNKLVNFLILRKDQNFKPELQNQVEEEYLVNMVYHTVKEKIKTDKLFGEGWDTRKRPMKAMVAGGESVVMMAPVVRRIHIMAGRGREWRRTARFADGAPSAPGLVRSRVP